ncbi:MAG: carboxypeptidase-like regulatory domain-containing protein [Kofleriaceae bacterium]
MQLGTLVIAGLFGTAGLVAGRMSAPTAPIVIAAAPRVAPMVIVAPTPVVAHEVAGDDIDADEPTGDPADPADPADDEAGGTDLAAVLANLHDQAASRPDRLAVLGQVTDLTEQPVVGCTVIVTGPNLDGTQTAITDEHGNYRVVGLPAGYYSVTFYYADQTIERTQIASREIEATQLDLSMDPNGHAERPVYEPPTIEPEQGITIDYDDTVTFEGDDYIENLPVPGRTFGSVLGAAAGSQDDSIGVSFTGVTSLENTYVIDED